MSEQDYIELLELNQRVEARLNECAASLKSIDQQMPEQPGYAFHKEKLHVLADAMRFATAELFLIRSSLERLERQA